MMHEAGGMSTLESYGFDRVPVFRLSSMESRLKRYLIVIVILETILLLLFGVAFFIYIPLELKNITGNLNKYGSSLENYLKNLNNMTKEFEEIYMIIKNICSKDELITQCY